jgi:hypothetical protein
MLWKSLLSSAQLRRRGAARCCALRAAGGEAWSAKFAVCLGERERGNVGARSKPQAPQAASRKKPRSSVIDNRAASCELLAAGCWWLWLVLVVVLVAGGWWLVVAARQRQRQRQQPTANKWQEWQVGSGPWALSSRSPWPSAARRARMGSPALPRRGLDTGLTSKKPRGAGGGVSPRLLRSVSPYFCAWECRRRHCALPASSHSLVLVFAGARCWWWWCKKPRKPGCIVLFPLTSPRRLSSTHALFTSRRRSAPRIAPCASSG